MMKIIGRKDELSRLNQYYKSGKPEFVAIYGRRRVGKTYLVDTCFDQKYDFYVSGTIEASMAVQLFNFNAALKRYGGEQTPIAKNWMEAFLILTQILEAKPKKERLLIFVDELPCFDTPRSGFVNAFDTFWNTWASKRANVMLIVCGSATSWMVENLIDSHGGLHNRITQEIHLKPFCLHETEEYLKDMGIKWPRLNVAQCYMAMGGIPYYLSLLNQKESLSKNLDRLFFAKDAILKREYERLFHALYRKPEKYMEVVEILAKSRKGLSRKEIIEKNKMASGEELTKILRNLEYCDFVRSYSMSGSPLTSNSKIYQIIDPYTLFYIKFCAQATSDPEWWSHNIGKSVQNDWWGNAFELLCISHIKQIKEALGISGIYTEYAGWRSKGGEKAQIDLLIDRADDMVSLCEMKYSKTLYILTKSEAAKLERRQNIFEQESKSNKGVQLVLITPMGLKEGKYSQIISNVVILDDLFRSE